MVLYAYLIDLISHTSEALVKRATFLEVDLLDQAVYPFKHKANITKLFSPEATPLSTGTRDL